MVDEPYYLYVEVDFEENELVIEFTGKILGKDYPKLISNETIYQCFDVINSNGAFSVAPEMLMNSVVVKCDVTFDIAWDGISNFTEYVRNNLINYQKYICRRLKNGNLVIEKNVTTRQYKKRLEIYDKGSEMSLIKNRSFLNYYFDGDNPFIGMCRFELNLNSKNQIRKSLCVSDCILHNVLASMQNPIVDFLNEILIKHDDSVEVSDWKSYQMKLVLEDCNYDLQMVEAKLRQYYSKGNNFFKIMKPYRELLLSSKSSMIRKTLFDKLTMC